MNNDMQKVAEEFDSYNHSYAGTVNNALDFTGMNLDFFTRVKIEYFEDLLHKELGSDGSLNVLDMGCGVGVYHDLLKSKVHTLHGVDISEKCIETAKKNNPNVFYTAYNGGTLPYADATFNAVVTICVMHHVPLSERDIFLSEVRRVMKPDGIFVIFEHNPLNPLTMKVVNNCPFDADAVLLKSKETHILGSKAGFRTLKSRFILSIPPFNKFLRMVDKIFSLLPFGAQYYTIARK